MKKIGKVAMAIFASLLIFYPAAAAAGAQLAEMKDDVVAAGGDWAAIEALLDSLSPEDRELVIATYPERLAELAEVRRAIEESGAKWTAGLTTVSILPPELRPGTGPSINPEGIRTVWPMESSLSTDDLPAAWDWRNVNGSNWMTPIKNQGTHGTGCFFGALGAVEPRMKLAANNPDLRPDLSEQYLISCGTVTCGDDNASELIAKELTCSGTVDDGCFRYDGVNVPPCTESCFDRDSRKYNIEGWAWVSGDPAVIDVARIKQEILFGGPVSSRMTVYADFSNYNGTGIYSHATGGEVGSQVVDILGWGTDNSTDYWICKNSWGVGWGDSGWFRIEMGDSHIGYEALAYQPKIRGKVLFYEGHGPVYALIGNYSEWGNRLAGNGYLVHSSDEATLTAELLACYDVVVIANPEVAFSADELAALKEFVMRGRVIAAGDGDLFENAVIYKQDNVKAAVQYVDWLATGDGGGLMVMGERALSNAAANQVANLFGLKINSDIIHDPKRYEADTFWPILGPKEDVLVPASASLAISKDAFPLARTTSSGYVTAGVASSEAASSEAAEVAVTPEEIELSVMSADEDAIALDVESAGYEILPEDMPPAGDLSPEGELATAPAEEAGMEVSSDPVPMAGLSFTGPIVIAAIDFGRKGEDTVGIFRNGGWHLDYENDAIPDKVFGYGTGTDIPITGDWSGDGKDTVGIFRNGGWHLDYDNNGIPDETFGFGVGTDVPITGDWNGDGRDSVGLFRDGIWILDYDNNGIPDKIFGFGISTDIPITGDWNGDGKDTAGIFRNGGWHLDFDNDGIPNKIFGFGIGTDVPIIGDWNGDGKDSVGLFRDGLWILDYDNDGIPDKVFNYGLSTDIPVVGDWYKN
jgi:C1A family cysteine protease